MLSGAGSVARKVYRLEAYMDVEMPLALRAADLVLCRSGASVLSELAVLGKPSILVPLPPAIGSSPQEANAAMFERRQAAEVIVNDILKPELIVERVTSIVTSPARLITMANNVSQLAKPAATQEIVDTIVQMVKGPIEKAPKYEVTSI